jgi:hypothetical protein
MIPNKIVVSVVFLTALFGGCKQEKSVKDAEFTSTAKTPAVTPAATQDIFDEFYKDDSPDAKKQPQKKKSDPVVRTAGAPGFTEGGRYVVQVAVVPSRAQADKISAALKARGYPSYVAEVNNPTPSLPGTYYRVRIGGFSGFSAARSFGESTLLAEGYQYWVDRKSNDHVGSDGYEPESSGASTISRQETPSSWNTPVAPAEPVPELTPEPPPPPPAPEPPPPPPPPPPPAPAPEPPATTPSLDSEWGEDGW